MKMKFLYMSGRIENNVSVEVIYNVHKVRTFLKKSKSVSDSLYKSKTHTKIYWANLLKRESKKNNLNYIIYTNTHI